LVNSAGIAGVGVAVRRVGEFIEIGKWHPAETGRVCSILRRWVALHRSQQALVLNKTIPRVALTSVAR